MSKELERFADKISEIKYKIELKVEQREDIFEYRSDQWQESEKGLAYEEKTQELRDAAENLDLAFDCINNFVTN